MKGEWSGIFYYVREVNFHLRIRYPFTVPSNAVPKLKVEHAA